MRVSERRAGPSKRRRMRRTVASSRIQLAGEQKRRAAESALKATSSSSVEEAEQTGHALLADRRRRDDERRRPLLVGLWVVGVQARPEPARPLELGRPARAPAVVGQALAREPHQGREKRDHLDRLSKAGRSAGRSQQAVSSARQTTSGTRARRERTPCRRQGSRPCRRRTSATGSGRRRAGTRAAGG